MSNQRPTTRPPGTPGGPLGEEYWRNFLEKGGDTMRYGRRVLSHIPANPRCRVCGAPFSGPGAPVMRLLGKRPSTANPNWCTSCSNELIKHRGGAEVAVAMLFADIRGSTALAEGMSPGEFHDLLDRYLSVASDVVFRHDGFVDKFVGDELVALFFPLMTGERFVSRATEAGRQLLVATGHDDADGPWVSIGVGVHTGRAWFGVVGDEPHVELTVVGDTVNVAARIAAQAQPGELLVSSAAAAHSELDPGLERRTLELKGKELPMEVVSVRLGATDAGVPAGRVHG